MQGRRKDQLHSSIAPSLIVPYRIIGPVARRYVIGTASGIHQTANRKLRVLGDILVRFDAGVRDVGVSSGDERGGVGAVEVAEFFFDIGEPAGAGAGVGTEGFVGAFVFVVEERAAEAEISGARIIGKAGGIAGAHLEEDARGEFF